MGLNIGVSLMGRMRSRLAQADVTAAPVKRDKRKRPASLAYDVDEAPPLPLRITLSAQHVLAMAVGWIYVVVGVNSMGGTPLQAESLIRMSMIASGVATMLQASRGPLGRAIFVPLLAVSHISPLRSSPAELAGCRFCSA